MFFQNLIKSGWLHAMFIAVFAYPAASMTQKFVASYTTANLLVYTSLFMLSSAVALLFIAGPGELANSTLRRIETWIYSVLQIFTYLLFLMSVAYVSATEGAALGMMSGLFTLIMSVLFLHQKVTKFEFIGGLVIFSGFYLIIYNTPLAIEAKAALIAIVVIRALLQASQKVITEIHKTNRKATSFKSQMRVTGFIMAVASFVFLLFLLLMAWVKTYHNIEFLQPFPVFSDFINFKCFVFAIFLGFFVISLSKYCEFYAGKTIGAKYLTSITSLQIIFVYIIEGILAHFDIIEKSANRSDILLAITLVLIGNFIISLAGFVKDFSFIKKGEKQDTLKNMEENILDSKTDFEILKINLNSIMSLYDNNLKKVADDLEISLEEITKILHFKFEDARVSLKSAKIINDFASLNVSLKDKLTKAYNRYYMEHKAQEFKQSNTGYKVYFLDLDKFKPVNDKHGHEIGDKVLVEIADRLDNLLTKKDILIRLGGDEFVIMQMGKQEDISEKIIDTIEQPITVEGIDELLEVSASVGVSKNSLKYKNIEQALEAADKNMFNKKGGR